MTKPRDVVVLVGSLRRASFSRKVARVLLDMAPPSLLLEIVEIGELAHFDQDAEADPPSAWVGFRQRLKAADAFLFVTPEYNRSVPGVLKNAIDVGSRPDGRSVFSHKAGAVVSVSPGKMGAFGANHHLRQSLVSLDVATLQAPEMYLGNADELFDEEGWIVNDRTSARLQRFIDAFESWVELVLTRPSP